MSDSSFSDAMQLHQSGDFSAAETAYRKILSEDSNHINTLHGLAILLTQVNRPTEAVDFINKACQLSPTDKRIFNSCGNIYLKNNDQQKAKKSYKKAIAIDSSYSSAHQNLGNVHYNQKDFKEAKKCYEKAISLCQPSAQILFNYATALAQLKEYSNAITQLNKCLKEDNQFFIAQKQLAEIHQAEKNYQKAISYYENYHQNISDDPDSYIAQGSCELQIDQLDDALAHLKKAYQLNKEHLDIHYLLATAYLKLGNFDLAMEHYLSQIDIKENQECYYNIGVILMYQEKHRDAISYLRQSLAYNTNYLPAHLNLGAIYLKIGQPQKAMNHYNKILTLEPNNEEVKHILAALSQEKVPKTSPASYVENLFDHYSPHYEKHLTEYLQYNVPELLQKMIQTHCLPDKNSLTILDLGCGTGLCADYLKPYAKEIIGNDLSEKMLAIAKEKKLYDELYHEDINQTLARFTNDIDLIVAGDVFTYVGDLEKSFKLAKNTLKENAFFAFSVEKNFDHDFTLQESIRYAHSLKYIHQLADQFSFESFHHESIILRKERGSPMEGYLILLKKVT